MDLRHKTDYQLCLMARSPGSSATSALQHRSQDKLVLWPVGTGKVPGKSLPTAPPGGITDWRARVAAWYSAGMPCN